MFDRLPADFGELPAHHVAAVSPRVGDYPVLKLMPTPKATSLKAGQALVKILYAGVCHSDVALALGKGTHRPIEPVISGHEGTGYIVALGDHVRPGPGSSIGDRVGIKFIADTCGTCDACLSGNEESCETPEVSGITRQGVFQQFVIASTRHLTPIPDEVSLAMAAPVLCAGLTVYKALLNANLKFGEWVVIPGAGGGLGHLAVQYALAMGFRVIAVDTGDDKKALMQKYGVHRWIDFRIEKDIPSAVKTAANGRPIKAAIVTAGSIGPYQQALTYLGSRSTLVCVGFPKDSKFTIDVVPLVLGSCKIIGSNLGNRAEAKMALNYVAMGKVTVEMQVRPLSEISDVYMELEAGKVSGRIVVSLEGAIA